MVLTRNLQPVIITPMADGRWQLTGALNVATVLQRLGPRFGGPSH